MRFISQARKKSTSYINFAHTFRSDVEGEIRDIGVTPDDQEYYLQELLLARHARNLLARSELKKLLNFSRMVEHDMKPWLARER
jgi:hypothetical protein